MGENKSCLNVLLVQPPPQESVSKDYVSTQIPINLAYVGSALESVGANVKAIDFCVEEYSEEKMQGFILSFKPDIIGFTSMTPSIFAVRDIARFVKGFNDKILLVLGGVHISALPNRTMEELAAIDVGVIGEGEETIKELYGAILNNKDFSKINGLIYRADDGVKISPPRTLIQDLDSVPIPKRSLFDVENYAKSHVSRGFSRKHLKIAELITSRGCPNRCIFCAGHINYGYSLRFRSFENIKSEVEGLINDYGINHLSIEDDTFTLNKELVMKLCDLFKNLKLSWNCNVRVNTVDLELLKLMKSSGCKKISFGVESGSPRMLKLIKKGITVEMVKNTFKLARKAGIKYVEGTFLLGSHPDETFEDIKQTKKLMFELRPDFCGSFCSLSFSWY